VAVGSILSLQGRALASYLGEVDSGLLERQGTPSACHPVRFPLFTNLIDLQLALQLGSPNLFSLMATLTPPLSPKGQDLTISSEKTKTPTHENGN
jgi:hypothetical protein